MDRIQAMQVFTRVVETGSFVRAAEELSMQKPKATRLVQWLEARLQTPLLNRTTRRVTVTTDGAAYYEHASRVLDDLAEIEATLRSARTAASGRLRADLGTGVGARVLVPALPEFRLRHPEVQLELSIGGAAGDSRLDSVDCCLQSGDPSDESLVARRIGSVPYATVAAPAYLREYGVPDHPAQITGQHAVVGFLAHRNGRPEALRFERRGEVVEVAPGHGFALNEVNAHVQAAVAGLGVAQVPRCVAAPHLQTGDLVPVLGEWSCRSTPLYAVYAPSQRRNARVRAFVAWACDVFARHPAALDNAGTQRTSEEMPATSAACRGSLEATTG